VVRHGRPKIEEISPSMCVEQRRTLLGEIGPRGRTKGARFQEGSVGGFVPGTVLRGVASPEPTRVPKKIRRLPPGRRCGPRDAHEPPKLPRGKLIPNQGLNLQSLVLLSDWTGLVRKPLTTCKTSGNPRFFCQTLSRPERDKQSVKLQENFQSRLFGPGRRV